MSFNTEELIRFEEASHWYNKAVGKIAKRYHRGILQEKEFRYADVVASATLETEEIDIRYQMVLNGACTIDQFKDAIADWFYKVKKGMDAVDVDARKRGEKWCDFYDKREEH